MFSCVTVWVESGVGEWRLDTRMRWTNISPQLCCDHHQDHLCWELLLHTDHVIYSAGIINKLLIHQMLLPSKRFEKNNVKRNNQMMLVMKLSKWTKQTKAMSYSTLRRSRTYIVVPRDVDPQNFIYVPETRKVRNIGLGKCFFIPLLVFLVVGGVLGVAGYFLHQHSQGEGLLEWPSESLLGESEQGVLNHWTVFARIYCSNDLVLISTLCWSLIKSFYSNVSLPTSVSHSVGVDTSEIITLEDLERLFVDMVLPHLKFGSWSIYSRDGVINDSYRIKNFAKKITCNFLNVVDYQYANIQI